MYDISKIIEWQKQGHRKVDINIGSSDSSCKKIRIWVYDYSIGGCGTGTFISDPDKDFDLQATADEREKAELARLTEKYREGATHV